MTVGPLNEENFKDLTEEEQEALFALSCLGLNQRWSGAVEWTSEEWEEQVIQHGLDLMSKLHSGRLHTIRRTFSLSDDREVIKQKLLQGDLYTRKFLAWYLEDNIPEASCETESDNTRSEPDVTILSRDIPDIKIEIKRMVTTNNTLEYGQSFSTSSWHENDPSIPSLLIIYFPLISTPEWRVRTFVQGYRGLMRELNNWEEDWMHSLMVPAPIHPNSGFKALESTRAFVEENLNTGQ